MRRLYTLAVMLGLLSLSVGCGESCLFRGDKPPVYQPCAPVVEPGCGCGCTPTTGCATCGQGGMVQTMPGG